MKIWNSIFVLALTLCLLSACGAAPAEDPESPDGAEVKTAEGEDPPAPGSVPSLEEDEEPVVLTCRIVDGAENGDLLLAELDEGLYGGTGVYRLNLGNGGPRAAILYGDGTEGKSQPLTVPVYLDGELADASVLEDGMPVDIAFNGAVAETFPAQLGEVYSVTAWSRGQGKNGAGSLYDLCGLYLQVLDDLWQKDPVLNEDIAVAGLDLSEAPGGLTESEKAALAWRFGEAHGVEVVTGTFQELEEQGYFTASAISTPPPDSSVNYSRTWNQWEDGCLFSITPNEEHQDEVYSLPALFFNAEKWRAPLAAYCFYDCSAMWAEAGTWNGYQIGGEMIS